MENAMRVVSWILMSILFIAAFINIATQLQEGVQWSELNWWIPFCFGGIGTGLLMAEYYGLFDTSLQNDNYECDARDDSGE